MSTPPTSVYRYYDADGALVYVGITARGIQRQNEHNAHAEWWPFVVRQDVEHYPDRDDAAARERELIQRFRPPFNRQHNDRHEALKADYLASVRQRPTSGSCGMELDCSDPDCLAFADWQTGWCRVQGCPSCHRAYHNLEDGWAEGSKNAEDTCRVNVERLCTSGDAEVAAAAYEFRAAAQRLANLTQGRNVQEYSSEFWDDLRRLIPTDADLTERIAVMRELALQDARLEGAPF